MVAQAHSPRVLRSLSEATSHLSVDQQRAPLATAVDIGASVDRVVEHSADYAVARSRPSELLGHPVASRHLQPVVREVADDGERTSIKTEAIEDQPHHTLDLPVRVEA